MAMTLRLRWAKKEAVACRLTNRSQVMRLAEITRAMAQAKMKVSSQLIELKAKKVKSFMKLTEQIAIMVYIYVDRPPKAKAKANTNHKTQQTSTYVLMARLIAMAMTVRLRWAKMEAVAYILTRHSQFMRLAAIAQAKAQAKMKVASQLDELKAKEAQSFIKLIELIAIMVYTYVDRPT